MNLANTIIVLTLVTAGLPAAAGEPTYRVVVALREPRASGATLRMANIDAAQRRVGRILDGRRGSMSRVYSQVPAFSAVVTREGWAALASDPDVAKVDLDLPGQVAMATVAARVGAIDVQTQGLTGKGVTVAIIDSGVEASHPDLLGAVIDEACFCMDVNGTPCCPNGTARQFGPGAAHDDHGHGTHLAGIIAGRGHLAPRAGGPGRGPSLERTLRRPGDRIGHVAGRGGTGGGRGFVA